MRFPSVDALSQNPSLAVYPQRIRVLAARRAIDAARDEFGQESPGDEWLAGCALREAASLADPRPRRALNMTGVLIHTGLGRSPLQLGSGLAAALGSVDLEFDLETGARGDRQAWVRDLLCQLTGAEDALVVNNCAAAVLLTLSALCAGKEVILSRGQMVEIGGEFRMPDVIRQSGCHLVEVGCTNKTRVSDYQNAITESTAAILRCHPSNFRVVGFVAEPAAGELLGLGPLLLDDLGHGCLVDTSPFGIRRERTMSEAVRDADVVMASGDKLLGGPQAGLILGSSALIARIKKHPLARAVRADKLALASLADTLQLYLRDEWTEIPLWRSIRKSAEQTRLEAESLCRAWSGRAEAVACVTEIGAGSFPGEGLAGFAARLESASPDKLAGRLRSLKPAMVGRVSDGAVLLDPRALMDEELEMARSALSGLEPDA